MAAGPVPKEALEWFRAKGLKVGFDYRDVWKEEHSQAFTVAKAMRQDILTDIRGAVDEALAEGKTFQQFQKELTPTLQKKGWWGIKEMVDPLTGEAVEAQLGSPRRLRTIYRTNMKTARAAGQWQRIQRTVDSHPYLLYLLGPSEEHRPQHVKWKDLMLPVDHVFWETHYPQNGWGCKCHVRQVSRAESDRLMKSKKVKTDAPDISYRDWVNKRTGEVQRIPQGIDPGWDYNPGAKRGWGIKRDARQSEQAFQQAMATPLPKGHLWPEGTGNVFSTAKGVNQAGVEDVLAAVPGIEAQLEKVQRFMKGDRIKAVFLKQGEIGRGKRVWELQDDIGEFLGPDWPAAPWMAYTTRRPGRVNGFTFKFGNHVVVKVKARDRLDQANPEKLAAAVEQVIQREKDGRRMWSLRESTDAVADEQTTGILATFIHELGHKVHFAAGTPRRPLKSPALTMYSTVKPTEWYAEHFTAWLLNRKALAEWDPAVAEHFDQLIETAIRNSE